MIILVNLHYLRTRNSKRIQKQPCLASQIVGMCCYKNTTQQLMKNKSSNLELNPNTQLCVLHSAANLNGNTTKLS